MKNLSYWAKKNPRTARTIIVMCKMLLGVYGLYMGGWLMAHDIPLPPEFLQAAVLAYIAAIFFYPLGRKATGLFRYSYRKQKICDFIIGLSVLLMFVGGGNDFSKTLMAEGRTSARAVAVAIRPSVQTKDWRTPTPVDNHQRSWLGRAWQKGKNFCKGLLVKSRRSRIDVWRALMTLLLATIALFLLLGVASLSCSLACNGADGLASVVLIGGIGAVSALFIIAMKAAYRMPKEKYGVFLGALILILAILLLLIIIL